MIPRISIPLLLAFALCMPGIAEAKEKHTPRATPTPHHTVIESVSTDSITVTTTGGGSSQTYKVTASTEITYNGSDVPLSQLQPGMRVDVTPDGADPDTASIINANEAPKSPTPRPTPYKPTAN